MSELRCSACGGIIGKGQPSVRVGTKRVYHTRCQPLHKPDLGSAFRNQGFRSNIDVKGDR
jgi:hypothetical protein